MKSMDFLNILRSPCCYSPLKVESLREINGILYNGKLICQHCREAYPVVKGVVYLTLLNSNWDVILQELVSRRNIIQRNMESTPSPEQSMRREQQAKVAADIMETLFQEAWKIIDPRPDISILDVGAGEAKTTLKFATSGASALATDTDPSGLHYFNFACLQLPPPRSFTLNQQIYYEYPPTPVTAFFQRLIAPAEHLPFRSNVFDITFCRSTLHHLSRLHSAIREMMRVTKPHGKIVFCSEPIRSILDPEDFYLEGVVDREEGLNERTPTILHYLLPLLTSKTQVKVQYWRRPPAPITRIFTSFLPVHWDKHFFDGELATGRKLLKLLLTSASTNIYALKLRLSPDRKPEYWDCYKIENVDALAEIYGWRDWEEPISQFSVHTAELMHLRRRILNQKGYSLSEFKPYKLKSYQLWQGWGKVYTVGQKQCRLCHPVSLVTLKLPPSAKFLNLVYFLPAVSRSHSLKIKINQMLLGKFPLQAETWHTLKVPLPDRTEPIVDITLELIPPLHSYSILSHSQITRLSSQLPATLGLFIHHLFFSSR
ncbi:MAG: methyltransferase domain-containing protein [Candidatus Sumerlaeia bacterium]|nr:methyltransferase domain-containing protein [Candidatus Sumerlaeia bacterium]